MDKVTGMRQEDGKFFITVQPGVILQKLNESIAAWSFDSKDWDEAAQETYKAFTKAPVQMFTPDPTESTAFSGLHFFRHAVPKSVNMQIERSKRNYPEITKVGGAKTVIAINTDPKAPIFSVSDYRIVGDCVTVLEQLLRELE